jgi:hypothetical protein
VECLRTGREKVRVRRLTVRDGVIPGREPEGTGVRSGSGHPGRARLSQADKRTLEGENG